MWSLAETWTDKYLKSALYNTTKYWIEKWKIEWYNRRHIKKRNTKKRDNTIKIYSYHCCLVGIRQIEEFELVAEVCWCAFCRKRDFGLDLDSSSNAPQQFVGLLPGDSVRQRHAVPVTSCATGAQVRLAPAHCRLPGRLWGVRLHLPRHAVPGANACARIHRRKIHRRVLSLSGRLFTHLIIRLTVYLLIHLFAYYFWLALPRVLEYSSNFLLSEYSLLLICDGKFSVEVAVSLLSVDELLEFMDVWVFTISFATCQPENRSECIHACLKPSRPRHADPFIVIGSLF